MGESLKRRIVPSAPLCLEVENGDGTSFTVIAKVAIDFNVLSDAQERCGHNFLQGGLSWVDNAAQIRALLWASLLPYQPGYRDEELIVGEYMTLDNRLPIVEALLKAYGFFVRKDARKEFQESAAALIEFMRTGKAPEGKENAAAVPLASTEASSTGLISSPLPNTTSDSAEKSSAA